MSSPVVRGAGLSDEFPVGLGPIQYGPGGREETRAERGELLADAQRHGVVHGPQQDASRSRLRSVTVSMPWLMPSMRR
ncbi:hypothetical protein AB0C12_27550 [Actinoplanes sp. NPDC048967]|uniref:hypothetical protein n=1 Tax=Actinoplanes sp. NPDC048967 TaxID=3155269 RepID=UPI0033EBB8F5